MPLHDILHKKDQIHETNATGLPSNVPEIRFVAPDPSTTEPIPERPSTPTYDNDHNDNHHLNLDPSSSSSPRRKSLSHLLRRSRSPSESSAAGASPSGSPSRSPSPSRSRSRPRRLSNLLHRSGSRSASPVSAYVPADLPRIHDIGHDGSGIGDGGQEREAQWERRATVLVQNPLGSPSVGFTPSSEYGRARSSSRGVVGDSDGDANIQEAIRLHEAGELEKSTTMFGQLANPDGANNALSQVLYGLALRHGWGCTQDPARAISYLSAAACNSASIESEALQAGITKGGAAKGELVLAIFELANCFRNGWGVDKDPVAARQYFETAANLGDADAMNEVAWCYLEGFGGRKDKVSWVLAQEVTVQSWVGSLEAKKSVHGCQILPACRGKGE